MALVLFLSLQLSPGVSMLDAQNTLMLITCCRSVRSDGVKTEKARLVTCQLPVRDPEARPGSLTHLEPAHSVSVAPGDTEEGEGMAR